MEHDRGKQLLDAIHDDVDRRLNPNMDECWFCGGEGYVSDCFEEFACIDPEGGCEDCTTRCPECRIHAAQRAKAVREEVIKSGDVALATAWLKDIGRWRDGITPEQIGEQMAAAKAELETALAV